VPALLFETAMSRCPIPGCKKSVSFKKLMCSDHRKMIPDIFTTAIAHANSLLHERTDLGVAERMDIIESRRQAAAFAFAVVCEKCGITPDQLRTGPKVKILTASIRKEIHG
jgi:hypothetical protein